jgi:peptide chain release factor 1
MEERIKRLQARFKIIEEQLGRPEILQDQAQYRQLAQEHAYLSQVVSAWLALSSARQQLADNKELLREESDPEFVAILQEDVAALDLKLPVLQQQLEQLLVPPDPNDHRNTILEVRAGTGGDEAALFVGDCVRMYKMFADRMGWRYELLSCAPAEVGGFKEYVMVLSGTNVHRCLRYEGGTHRVQRVPTTEAQGRVHTSAITVATLMEPDAQSEITIDEKELRIDTYRSSGAGGQHVNTTDSAVRITHLPSGLVVYSQEERSQHKNKDKAMRLLQAKLVDLEEQKLRDAIASSRSQQVGSGDRSERIRTYNFPQNRVTDHRINLTLYNLDRMMEGDLEAVVTALVAHFYQERLRSEGIDLS